MLPHMGPCRCAVPSPSPCHDTKPAAPQHQPCAEPWCITPSHINCRGSLPDGCSPCAAAVFVPCHSTVLRPQLPCCSIPAALQTLPQSGLLPLSLVTA